MQTMAGERVGLVLGNFQMPEGALFIRKAGVAMVRPPDNEIRTTVQAVRYVRGPAIERFVNKVQFTDSCWCWIGAKNKVSRYGIFRDTKAVSAHRWAYQYFRGEIPAGLTLDHLCRVRQCVNPDHLEPVTQRENLLRGQNLKTVAYLKNECMKGHDLATHGYPNARGCRTCRNEWLKQGEN